MDSLMNFLSEHSGFIFTILGAGLALLQLVVASQQAETMKAQTKIAERQVALSEDQTKLMKKSFEHSIAESLYDEIRNELLPLDGNNGSLQDRYSFACRNYGEAQVRSAYRRLFSEEGRPKDVTRPDDIRTRNGLV